MKTNSCHFCDETRSQQSSGSSLYISSTFTSINCWIELDSNKKEGFPCSFDPVFHLWIHLFLLKRLSQAKFSLFIIIWTQSWTKPFKFVLSSLELYLVVVVSAFNSLIRLLFISSCNFMSTSSSSGTEFPVENLFYLKLFFFPGNSIDSLFSCWSRMCSLLATACLQQNANCDYVFMYLSWGQLICRVLHRHDLLSSLSSSSYQELLFDNSIRMHSTQ